MKCLKSCLFSFFIILLFYFVTSVAQSLDCALTKSGPDKVAYTITVDIIGSGNFTKVQDAVNAIPADNNGWIHILIKPGKYQEQVSIPPNKPCIYLEGQEYPKTIISWGSSAQTDTSATFSASPDNIVAKNIVFENSYKIESKPRAEIKPALAARLYGDKYVFVNCSFIGIQDTLWDVSKRHYFKGCYIEGAIDFIFGSGQSIYEGCTMHVNIGKYDPTRPAGVVTAQGRSSATAPDGFVFKQCTVTGSGKALLGRAYGAYSRVIFYQSKFDNIVVPQGWDPWRAKGKENNLVYMEKDCSGPGADIKKRVAWMKNLSEQELEKFVNIQYIDSEGWMDKLPLGVLA